MEYGNKLSWLQLIPIIALLYQLDIRDDSFGFDRFYLFMSEPDFSLRARAAGWKAFIDCESSVESDGVRASGKDLWSIFTSRPLRYHVVDAIKYYLNPVARGK